jgi:hypothetical protein
MSRGFARRLSRLEQDAYARTAPTWAEVDGAIEQLTIAARKHVAAILDGHVWSPSAASESRATWAPVARWCCAHGTTGDPGEAGARLSARLTMLADRHASDQL